MRTLPGGTVTFLFTDIEGSTRLLHALGDRYAEVLADHRRLLREAFTRNGGVEVDTQGDSFFVAFPDPGGAVAAAADAQRSLADHPWPDGTAVRVRMGLHTGEPLLSDDHYVGIDVHRGARIAAAAHGGQVLVSDRTCELVGSEVFRDVGAHPLKDLPEPERLYQLVIDGLPSSFPPPRAQKEVPAAAGLPDYSAPPADVPCPYKGLIAFEPADEDVFFGREELVEDLVGRLQDGAFLVVVGASGSGKSSLVRAGVVPGLLRADPSLRPAIIQPGARPLAALEAADDAGLLVVDQFEEVFTLCRDEDERRAFIDALLEAADEGRRVILALRADFYGHCAEYPRLASALEERQALVGPMSEEELRRAIERPAEQAGLVLEPGLVEGILRDVVGQPGALPLLSHSLLETWRRRSGRVLTLIGYLQAGGVQGAIARTAETVYREALTPEEQVLARNVFLRLTELGEGTEDTRRRVAIAELTPRAEQRETVDEVLRTLADARLVTIGEGTVEVAHEALIRHWPTLRAWLDEDREGRLTHRRLTQAAQEWDATGRDPALLFRGIRLTGASEWALTNDNELNELEHEFLDASRDAEVHEIEATHRRNRRLRALLAGAVAALTLAIVAGVLALNQRNSARATALTADAQRLGAEALTEERIDRALLLARAGVELEETARTQGNLLAALLRSPHAAIGLVGGIGDAEIFTAALSPDGRVLAIGDASGLATTFDTTTRRRLGRYRIGATIGSGLVQAVAFSPDGDTLAVTGYSRFVDPTLVLDLLDADTLERRARVVLEFPEQAPLIVASPVFTADGRDVLVLLGVPPFEPSGPRSELQRIDPRTGTVELRVRVGRAAIDLVATEDRDRVFVPSAVDDSTVEVEVASLRVVRRHPAGGEAGAISPDGATLALGSVDSTVRLLDLRSGRARLFEGDHEGRVLSMAFAADGDTLLSADFEGGIIGWDTARGEVRERFSAHTGPVWKLVVSPDGRTLYSASADARVLLWDVPGDRRLVRPFALRRPFAEEIQTPRGLAVSPDGGTLAVTHDDGTVDLLETGTLRTRATVDAMPGLFAAAVAFSPDGRLLAVAGERGEVTLWDSRTLAPAGRLEGLKATVQAVAFSPDGELVAAAEVEGRRPILAVWSVRRRALVAESPTGPGASIAFSPDGRLLALAAVDGDTQIREARTADLLESLPAEGISRSVAFSPDGGLLAVGQFDGTGQLYSTATWEPHGRSLEAGTQRITSVEFSPDGRSLVTATAGGTLRLWDVETQEPLGSPLTVEPEGFVSAAFSPDGSYVFAVSTTTRGISLATTPDRWKRQACLIAGREFTMREWTDALPNRPYRTVCAAR